MIANYNGDIIDLFNLKIDDIHIEDAIQALPNLCRFGGRSRYYSVAQHSVELSIYLESIGKEYLCPIALLHDAPEAYIGDLIYPIKINYPSFLEMENNLSNLFYEKYNIDKSLAEEFDYYDKNVVVNEMKHLDIWYQNKPLMSTFSELPNFYFHGEWNIEISRMNYKNQLNKILNLKIN